MWVLFLHGGNFRKEGNIAKNVKITPTRRFPRLQYISYTEFMKPVCFYIPKPLARGYKTHEFHKYSMKWKYIPDSSIICLTCKRSRHMFVKHRCPRQQQSQNLAKSYILTPPHPQGMCCQWDWATLRWTYTPFLVSVWPSNLKILRFIHVYKWDGITEKWRDKWTIKFLHN